MKYENIVRGRFLSRPNRFVAQVEIEGREEVVHVKNTGRCRELLIPGCQVVLERADAPNRKTKYDLIAVYKETEAGCILINMDSQIPNAAAEEWIRAGNLFPNVSLVRREVRYGNSRFDLYVEHGDRRTFIEVKGVTLEENGIARFPDAPTERGIKHVNELVRSIGEGFEACILFVIQMKGICEFQPNDATHEAFGKALRAASAAGVNVMAVDCLVAEDSIQLDRTVPVNLLSIKRMD